MRTGTTARSIAVTGAVLLAVTACGGGSSSSGDTGGSSGEKQVNVYGTDGNMGNALGKDFDSGHLTPSTVSGTYALTDAARAYADVERGVAGRPVLIPGSV